MDPMERRTLSSAHVHPGVVTGVLALLLAAGLLLLRHSQVVGIEDPGGVEGEFAAVDATFPVLLAVPPLAAILWALSRRLCRTGSGRPLPGGFLPVTGRWAQFLIMTAAAGIALNTAVEVGIHSDGAGAAVIRVGFIWLALMFPSAWVLGASRVGNAEVGRPTELQP